MPSTAQTIVTYMSNGPYGPTKVQYRYNTELKQIEGIMHIRSAGQIRKDNNWGGVSLRDGSIYHKGKLVCPLNYPSNSYTLRATIRQFLRKHAFRYGQVDSLDKLRDRSKRLRALKVDRMMHAGVKPPSTAKHTAVEIECTIEGSHEELAEAFVLAGLAPYCAVKRDGSINTNNDSCQLCEDGCECDEGNCECEHTCGDSSDMHATSVEVVVCARPGSMQDILNKVCAILNDDFDAKVDRSCGLHVHLDCRRTAPLTVYKALVLNQRLLFSMVPRTRARNSYCSPVTRHQLESVENEGTLGERYKAVNFEAYDKHRTIEVRLHSGTTNPVKIGVWVRLLHSIIKSKRSIKSIEDMQDIGMSLMDTVYIVGRLKKFAKQHGEKGWTVVAPDAAELIASDRDNEAA